jgi:hypothetical protein
LQIPSPPELASKKQCNKTAKQKESNSGTELDTKIRAIESPLFGSGQYLASIYPFTTLPAINPTIKPDPKCCTRHQDELSLILFVLQVVPPSLAHLHQGAVQEGNLHVVQTHLDSSLFSSTCQVMILSGDDHLVILKTIFRHVHHQVYVNFQHNPKGCQCLTEKLRGLYVRLSYA